MWAPSAEQLALLALPQEKGGVFHCVSNWLPPTNSDALEKWATQAVTRHFAPLSAALAPVKTCDKVARHAAHVLVCALLLLYLHTAQTPPAPPTHTHTHMQKSRSALCAY